MEDLRSDVDVDEYIFDPYLGMVDFLLIDVFYHTMVCATVAVLIHSIPIP